MKELSHYNGFARAEFQNQAEFETKSFYRNIKKSGSLVAVLFIFAVTGFVQGCKDDEQPSVLEQELDQVRNAVSSYNNLQTAITAGYDTEVTGYRSQMGFHYINGGLVDNKFEIDKPELLLYAPYGNESMKFVAVEYVTPITDINNPPPAPEGFTGSDDVWEVNTEFNLWTLHVWVGLDNDHGLFAPHNPKLP